MEKILRELKKTIVFFGKTIPDNCGGFQDSFFATGFLVRIQNFYHLVTAKHVVFDSRLNMFKDIDLWVAFNNKNGKPIKRVLTELKKNIKCDWIFHNDANVDIAIIPFAIDESADDLLTIQEELFLPATDIKELYDVFFLSFQPGIPYETKVNPIIRTGSISLINDNLSYYIDGSAFPGNSGSPVFLKPSLGRFTEEGGIQLGDPIGLKFIGLIGEYLPYQEIAISMQTEKPRIIFEENTGLSKVWSTKFFDEIMSSEKFKQQLNALQKN